MAKYIMIYTVHGRESIRAIVRDGLALHPSVGEEPSGIWTHRETGEEIRLGAPPGWTVTHIHTGYALAHLKNWHASLRYFVDVRKYIDWSVHSPLAELSYEERKYAYDLALMYNGLAHFVVVWPSMKMRERRMADA